MRRAKRGSATERAVVALAFGLAASGLGLGAAPAHAQCVQVGSTVTCVGTDPDGFPDAPDDRPPADNGLDITVESGAVVEGFVGPGGSIAAIAIQTDNRVTIEAGGAVTATGGAEGIVGGQSVGDEQNLVTNAGSIVVTGTGGTGVLLGSSGSVINEASGRIIVSSGLAGGSVEGIRVGAGGIVRNAGLVRVDGAGATAVAASGFESVVFSTGTIEASGLLATGVAIGGEGELVNVGLVDVSSSDGGNAVLMDGFESEVVNRGTIRGGSGTGAAIFVSQQFGTRRIFNEATGLIAAGGTSTTAIQGSTNTEVVENFGTIQGDVLLGGGAAADTFFWGSGSSVTGVVDGGAGSNDVVILLEATPDTPTPSSFALDATQNFERLFIGQSGGGGDWTLTGTSDYADGIFVIDGAVSVDTAADIGDLLRVDGGTLTLQDGNRFDGGLETNGGRVEIPDAATITGDLRLSQGDVSVAGDSSVVGDLTLSGGTLALPLDGPGDAGSVDATGTLVLGSGSRLELQQPAGAAPFTGGPALRVLTAGGQTGELGSIVVTGGLSPFLRGSATYGGAAGFVDVTITEFQANGASKNEARVYDHLQRAIDTGAVSPAFQDFLDSFVGLDDAQLLDAFDALDGAVLDAHTSTALATGSRVASLAARRPIRCERVTSPYRPDRPSQQPCGERGIHVWGEAFGSFRDRDGSDAFDDWSSAGGGLAVGADRRFGDLVVSGLLGASRSGLDLDDDGDGSYTSFELALGAGRQFGDTYVRGVVGYGHGWHTTHRDVSYPGVSRLALSDHESDRITLLAELGHRFRWMPFELEPLATVEYTWLREESFNETNAGAARLDVDSRTANWVATSGGLRASMTLVKYQYAGPLLEWADGVWRPEISATWRQVWNDYDRDWDAQLRDAPAGAGSFTASAEDSQYGGRFGAGISFQPHGSANTIRLGYDAFLGDGTRSHAVQASLHLPF